MKTLTLDISTHTGWALLDQGTIVSSGTIHLATEEELMRQRKEGKERTLDMRFGRLHQFICANIKEHGIERIVFEDVQFSSTQMQGQLWASLRSAIWAIYQMTPIQIFGVPVGTLKHFATGSGSAQKIDMAKALAILVPDTQVEQKGEVVFFRHKDGRLADDNEVDAIWLARYTHAVDRGEQDFLGVYQRKLVEKAEKRRKKAERKAIAKAKKVANNEVKAARQLEIKEAIKAAGKCCGVLREPVKCNRATCPKCGNTVKLDLKKMVADAANALETPVSSGQATPMNQ